jgi:hypothetical protein
LRSEQTFLLRRGTEGSNPASSREESSANFLEPTFDRKEFAADVTRFCEFGDGRKRLPASRFGDGRHMD